MMRGSIPACQDKMKHNPIKETVAEEKSEVSALARGLLVVQTIVQNGPLTVGDLASSTGIPKATVSRLVGTLMGAGYLRQQQGSTLCRLGPAFLATGNAYLGDLDIRTMLRPDLLEIANLAGAKVNLGVRSGNEIFVIDSIRPRNAVILSYIEIGARMALSTSAGGRAYLASLADQTRSEVLAELQAAHGPAWHAIAKRLEAAFSEYREFGYCTSFGEWHPEINAVSVVILGTGGDRYTVSCGGPTYKLRPDVLRDQIAPALVRLSTSWMTAERVSHDTVSPR